MVLVASAAAAANNEYSTTQGESDARVQPLQELTPFMAPAKDASVPYEEDAVPSAMDPDLFEDDPLANEPMQTALSGRAQDFEIAFQRLKEEDPEDVVDEIETVPAETDVFTDMQESKDKIRPSLPIRMGVNDEEARSGKLDKETGEEVRKEANVPAIGQDIEEAKKAGQQLAAVDKAKEDTSGKKTKGKGAESAPKTTDKQNKRLAKEAYSQKPAVHEHAKNAAGAAHQTSLVTIFSTALVALAFAFDRFNV